MEPIRNIVPAAMNPSPSTADASFGNSSTTSPTASRRRKAIRLHLAGFHVSVGRDIDRDALDVMADLAMHDWRHIPDQELFAVCAKARVIAAQRGTHPATTHDVLKAWREVSEDAYRNRAQREREAYEAKVREGRILPEPTISGQSEAGKNALMAEFYRTAGLPVPGHLLSPQPIDEQGIR